MSKRWSFRCRPSSTPWGDILGQLEEKEGVLVQEVPLEKLELYRGQIPILQGRRTDLYGTREA